MALGRASRAEPLQLLCLRAAASAAAPWPRLGHECLVGGRWAAGEREAGLRAPVSSGVRGWEGFARRGRGPGRGGFGFG